MAKKKKDQIIISNGEVYSQRYIYFNEDGKIEIVSPCEEKCSFEFIKVDDSLITDFIEGRKLYKDYTIDYFNSLANGIIIDDEKTISNGKLTFYVLPQSSNYENEITVEHFDDKWVLRSKIDIIEKEIVVYVCLKTNINFIVRSLSFTKENNYTVQFNSDIEKNLKMLSLVTKTKYNSYAVKESHE